MLVAKVPSKSFAIMYSFLIFQVSFKEKESKKKRQKKTTTCIKFINTKNNSYITFVPTMRSRKKLSGNPAR